MLLGNRRELGSIPSSVSLGFGNLLPARIGQKALLLEIPGQSLVLFRPSALRRATDEVLLMLNSPPCVTSGTAMK